MNAKKIYAKTFINLTHLTAIQIDDFVREISQKILRKCSRVVLTSLFWLAFRSKVPLVILPGGENNESFFLHDRPSRDCTQISHKIKLLLCTKRVDEVAISFHARKTECKKFVKFKI